MNRYGTASRAGPSKATATTLCQKCLKRDIYECKAIAQERPYVSRPSRTQQLLNPKLLPKLTSDVPQDLLKKKGIADEQLAKLEKERGLKRDKQRESSKELAQGGRSRSSSSSVSVATISTNGPESPQGRHESSLELARRPTTPNTSMHAGGRKRRRSISSEGSLPSDIDQRPNMIDVASTRSTRRKIGEHSPRTRGRRRSRAGSRHRRASNSSQSRSPDSSKLEGIRGREFGMRPDTYRGSFSRSRSTHSRQKSPLSTYKKDLVYRYDGRSRSRESSSRRVRSPGNEDGRRTGPNFTAMRRTRNRSFSSDNLGRRRYSDVDERYGTSSKRAEPLARTVPTGRQSADEPLRRRSLSPFSRRIALTKSMNMGR